MIDHVFGNHLIFTQVIIWVIPRNPIDDSESDNSLRFEGQDLDH